MNANCGNIGKEEESLSIFFFYINIYTLSKTFYNHQAYIYMLWYTWEQKNIHIKYKKKQPKNSRKIKILKPNQRKKWSKILNFKCSINVKAMTSGVHQKSPALNLLVSIKLLMVASNILVLLILSRSPLPYKRISVSWSLLK